MNTNTLQSAAVCLGLFSNQNAQPRCVMEGFRYWTLFPLFEINSVVQQRNLKHTANIETSSSKVCVVCYGPSDPSCARRVVSSASGEAGGAVLLTAPGRAGARGPRGADRSPHGPPANITYFINKHYLPTRSSGNAWAQRWARFESYVGHVLYYYLTNRTKRIFVSLILGFSFPTRLATVYLLFVPYNKAPRSLYRRARAPQHQTRI